MQYFTGVEAEIHPDVGIGADADWIHSTPIGPTSLNHALIQTTLCDWLIVRLPLHSLKYLYHLWTHA